MKHTKTTIALITLITGTAILHAEPAAPELIPPEPVEIVVPEIPYNFNRYPKKGKVIVKFELNKEGRTENVRLESAMNPTHGKSVVDAVSQWKFEVPTDEKVTYRLPVVIN